MLFINKNGKLKLVQFSDKLLPKRSKTVYYVFLVIDGLASEWIATWKKLAWLFQVVAFSFRGKKISNLWE